MKRILVPTDYSPNAEKAFNYAVQLAKQANGEIYLIHSADVPIDLDKLQDSKEDQAIKKTVQEAEKKLKDIINRVAQSEPVSIQYRLYSGTPVDSVLEAVKEFQIDFIVMGTIGNSGIKEKIYGSITAAIIGKSPVPVLAIPLLGKWVIPRKILLAINHFDIDLELLRPVFDLAEMYIATIQVAVFTDTDDDYVEDYSMHENRIEEFREKINKYDRIIEVHAVHLAGRHFMESLQHWVDTKNVDILVMLTHKRTLLKSIFDRSKTKKMSYHTNIPLLAIPI